MSTTAAIYVRVSTVRQAEKELSIPDQIRQAEAYCKARGIDVMRVFEERGASATSDRRPVFQKMIEQALRKDQPFDLIVVHSFSRFFRDMFENEFYLRKLKKNRVQVISITQDFKDDTQGEMMRKFANLMDEYSSKENAKHVLRSMKENARQGFWNGGPPPYGYKSVTVAVRGDANKKKLEVEPSEAMIVAKIYSLCEEGAGSGPLGMRSIASWLAGNGHQYRRGRAWSSGLVHTVLTNTAYKGEHYFNRRTFKTKELKDRTEWIRLNTPVIIDGSAFDRVQIQLTARRPTKTPPRELNGPTLLTGRVKCTSGAGMTLRTGKGGRYRYYTCQKHMNEGGCKCARHSVSVPLLDELVLSELESKVLVAERLQAILNEVMKRATSKEVPATSAKILDTERRAIESKLDRLYTDRAEGVLKDTGMFQRKIAEYESQLVEIGRRKDKANRPKSVPTALLRDQNLQRFIAAVNDGLRSENPAFRKALVRHLVDRIDVRTDEICISGSNAALIATLNDPEKQGESSVPSFV